MDELHRLATQDVIQRAAAFIRQALATGRYSLSVQGSDGTTRFSDQKGHVFVGHYVARGLRGLLNEVERTILLVRILSEENTGCWGFSPAALDVSAEHETFVVDADDTAYVLRTLRELGAFRAPIGLEAFFRHPPGAFVTFAAKGPFTNLPTVTASANFANNLACHPEVNANVYLMLRKTKLEHLISYELIDSMQHAEGYWPSFFYPGKYFANPLFVEFLSPLEHYRPHVDRTIQFLHAAQNADGSWGEPGCPYETALALRALAADQQFDSAYRRGVDYLVGAIAPAGSWSSNKVIWQFHDQNEDVWTAVDESGTLVTAMALDAIRQWEDNAPID